MRSLAVLCIFLGVFALTSDAEEAAGSAWLQLQALNAQAHEKVPIGTNAVEFYAGREKALHDTAAEFTKQFPNDVHEPQAMLWKIETTDFPDPAEQRIALLRQNEMDARPIVDDTALPADFRFQVERTILHSVVGQSGSDQTPDQAADSRESNR